MKQTQYTFALFCCGGSERARENVVDVGINTLADDGGGTTLWDWTS
jgi:hypothetical protein